MTARIRWGFIGCGAVTEVKSGPAFKKVEGSELVAVMRRDGEKARDYAARHGVPRWYDNAGQLLDDPDVDAIYVATPPDAHAEYTIRAAQAGKPVYVEKPMGRTYAECLRMLDACQTAGVPLFVAYYRRCLPAFLKVKDLVDSGAIGALRFVTIELHQSLRADHLNGEALPWRVMPDIAGGGLFLDLASHQLDFLDYVLGPIAAVQGQAANQAGLYPAEDIVCATLAFESGVLGTGTWCFTLAPGSEVDRIQIVGAGGRIAFSSFGPDPVQLETSAGLQEFTLPAPEHVQQPLIETVVGELLGRGKCPSTGVTAARTNRVMDEILRDWRLASHAPD